MGAVTVKVRKSKFNLHPERLWLVLHTDPRMDAYGHRVATEIKDAAIAVFSSSQRWDNEWRLSETTPPKYIKSFKIAKLKRIRGLAWKVVNDDPGAVFVEFGAHAGGQAFVLRYRPLARAIDIVAAMNL